MTDTPILKIDHEAFAIISVAEMRALAEAYLDQFLAKVEAD